MITPETWMQDLTEKLKAQFGDELLFVGLQGSYQRGEAKETSDIDAVVLLKEVSAKTLKAYQKIIRFMPEGEKTCGFICGRQEFLNWPKYELFQFRQETKSYYGNLDTFLPALSREDILDSVRIGASNLYHAACHAYVFGNPKWEILEQLYKPAFFLIQVLVYLRHDVYIPSRQAILNQTTPAEREILEISNGFQEKQTPERSIDDCFDLLITWCGSLLTTDHQTA